MTICIKENTVPANNLSNRKILVEEIIKDWSKDRLLSYTKASLERWYRESNIDFELDWNKEVLKDDS